MTLRDKILKEHSKEQCESIVHWVRKSQERFNELLQLFLNDEYRVVQRAAWPLSYCIQKHPFLVRDHLQTLVRNLKKEKLHNAVKRNTVRLLQFVDIPEELQGEVMDACFRYISSVDEPVAVKAFSLTILEKLARSYPEILSELKLIIEERLPHETAAFKSRGTRILGNFRF